MAVLELCGKGQALNLGVPILAEDWSARWPEREGIHRMESTGHADRF